MCSSSHPLHSFCPAPPPWALQARSHLKTFAWLFPLLGILSPQITIGQLPYLSGVCAQISQRDEKAGQARPTHAWGWWKNEMLVCRQVGASEIHRIWRFSNCVRYLSGPFRLSTSPKKSSVSLRANTQAHVSIAQHLSRDLALHF